MKNYALLPIILSSVCSFSSTHAAEVPSEADAASAASQTDVGAAPEKFEGLIKLDYQVVPIVKKDSIDLMSLHLLGKLNDWAYLGVGVYAPLLRGNYSGFAAFDVTAHAQKKVYKDLFINGGISVGGGAGGKNADEAAEISGSGKFQTVYAGLGYDFRHFSAGVNVSRLRFVGSPINHTQLDLYVQIPFTTQLYPFNGAGKSLSDKSFSGNSESVLSLGVDSLRQIRPVGTYKDNVGLIDTQYSRFLDQNTYVLFDFAAGYRGLPIYNHILGGAGYRLPLNERVNLYGQIAAGSGGWAPESIDMGSGLLVYPKISAEYMLTKHTGLALSTGYLWAAKGTSKNLTFGASVNYHLNPYAARGDSDNGERSLQGYRFSVFPQMGFKMKYGSAKQDKIGQLSLQFDSIINKNIYIPVQGTIAYGHFFNYPGNGEYLAGIGLQTTKTKADRFQAFGQLLLGANVNGTMVKAEAGMSYSLSDRLAIFGIAGHTQSAFNPPRKYSGSSVGGGLSYRFSFPG